MTGSNIFGSISSLATKTLPTALPAITKIGNTLIRGLAHGVANALWSLGIDTLFGGSIYMKQEIIPYFAPFDVRIEPQLDEMNKAIQTYPEIFQNNKKESFRSFGS